MTAFISGSMGGGEVLIILFVLLLLFGAKRLPGFARGLGRMIEQVRGTVRGLNEELTQPSPPRTPKRIPPDNDRQDDEAADRTDPQP